MSEKNKPAKEFRLGQIKGSIWANEEDGKVRLSVSIVKSYNDSKGNWKTTDSFWPDELPILKKVTQKCLDYIMSQEV